ncbi:hypothetical protein LYZ86_17905 [Xanthomonas hortorum pv. cynarae]|uniref:hypothetical protein n=1 Tax=Xanthomonas hortorum TaxID=56454 RepID=UPI000CEDCADC|nr:hypothetical protein [Xanthomonas hortorum]MCE4351079.1 hypothetical protein [Xanthomonas hortorum pv. cynarae]PPU38600.1 hypothetical protein XcyCFBP4188_18295 [Xanthomonas hortorum pv. cynarae]CAD0302814.1 hypothetical protein CFBP2044_04200 [Xanthomonas hortorum pv. cynarae]CAD0302820.1 hypothetical protein CFBP2044_04200 [Xanthomonas hortorum pv. cynarae]
MLKGIVLFALGVLIGGVASLAITNAKWDEDQRFRITSYREINDKYNALSAESHARPRRDESLANNSYDRRSIKSCMLNSTIRSQAIEMHLANRAMSDVEKGLFQPLVPVVLSSKEKSNQSRRIDLTQEAIKLDDECLDQARIRHNP